MNEQINLLFTLDAGYLNPLCVELTSIYYNNPKTAFKIWLVHESITAEEIEIVRQLAEKLHFQFEAIKIDGSIWQGAPTVERYPKEMYFRLLAGEILPRSVQKVIYLDPDILVLNSVTELWNMDMDGNMLAAATHTGLIDVTTKFNQIRLDMDHGYYNSGVMLMDLDRAREIVRWEDISAALEKHGPQLMLPDQDILNYLYGKYAVEIPEERWNYDARMYQRYLTRSLGQDDVKWVMNNTVFLHFCGKPKPWQNGHDNRFTALYETYQRLMNYIMES